MRIAILIYNIFFLSNLINAQILNVSGKKRFYGLHINSTQNAPFFASFCQLNAKNKGLGIKLGYGKGNEKGIIYYTNNSLTTFGLIEYQHLANYYYFTPQIIPFSKLKNNSLFVIAFGVPLGISQNRLIQLHKNDPISGNYKTAINEINKYAGLELELSYWTYLGRKTAIKYGVSTGLHLEGNAPFQQVFNNLNADFTYYPGMYKTAYLNIQIGLLFTQIVNEKTN